MPLKKCLIMVLVILISLLVTGCAETPGHPDGTVPLPEPVLLARLPWQVAWLENSIEVAFNTVLEAGCGILTHDDLWLADAESGEVSQLLPDGLGGSFAFSPDGDAVLVANAESASMVIPGLSLEI